MTGGSSRVLLAATVTEIGNGPFVYAACRQCYCKLSPLENNSLSKCHKCSCVYKPEDVYHRFRLCAAITDSLSTANITVFGAMLDLFFGATASKFHEKMLCLQEKYNSFGEELVKFAIEQTFIGQNLLFGFKVNPSVLKKCTSQIPRKQVLLEDVVNDSLKGGVQTLSSSFGKPRRDLIAVQVAHQGKQDQDFRTVKDKCHEIVKVIEEGHKIMPEHLDKTAFRNFLNTLCPQNRAVSALQPSQSVSPYICGRSQAETSCSDNNLSSEAELSSIRLSCDKSIQKIKSKNKTGSLANITNVYCEVSKSVSLKRLEKSQKILVMKRQENQEDSEHFLRRSKRILAKREKRKYTVANEWNFSKEIDYCGSECTNRKSGSGKKMHDLSRGTPKLYVMAQEELSHISSSPVADDTKDEGNKDVMSRTQGLEGKEVDDSLVYRQFPIEENASNALQLSDGQILHQCAVKKGSKVDRDIPVGNNLKRFENSDTRSHSMTLQQETLSHEDTRISQSLINRFGLSIAHSPRLESDMELTNNLPSQLEPTLTYTCDNSDTQLEEFGNRISKLIRPSQIPYDRIEDWPESENLYDFLKAGQFHSETIDGEASQVNCYSCDRRNDKDLQKTGQLTQKTADVSQESVNKSNNNSISEKSCDKSLMSSYPDNVSFANVTSRPKRKSKKKILDENNLRRTFIPPIFHKPDELSVSSTALVSAELTAAPESEDIYECLGGIGLKDQGAASLMNECNKTILLPSPEKDRIYNWSNSCRFDEEVTHISKLESSHELSEKSQTSLDNASCNFEELKHTDNQTDEQLFVLPAGISVNKSNDSLKRPVEGNQLTIQDIVTSANCRFSSNLECVDKVNSKCVSSPSKSDSKCDAKVTQNITSNTSDTTDSKDLTNSRVDFIIDRVGNSPELNASCDLFESSFITPSSISRHNPRKHKNCDTKSVHFESQDRSVYKFCENYNFTSYSNSSLCTPATGNQKVRFKKKRKEILFHDFEIISHLPVPCPQQKKFKSCLKKRQSPQEADLSDCNSQDLFESPQQASYSKPAELNTHTVYKSHSSTANHQDSSLLTNPISASSPTTSVIPVSDFSGSQELFSSADTNSPLLRINSYSCGISKSEVQNQMKCSNNFKIPTHESPSALQYSGEQILSSKFRTSTFANQGTNRDSLDLFSQSFC